MGQIRYHPLTNRGHLDFSQLEAERGNDVILLPRCLAAPEQSCLREVISKCGTARTLLDTSHAFRMTHKAALLPRPLHRTSTAKGVRFIADAAFDKGLPHMAIALVVIDRRKRAVDRNFVEVGASQTRKLRVTVGEQPPLQQWVVAEINAGNEVSGMKCHLLCFGKIVVRVAIEGEFADDLHRHHRFRNQFGGIEQVEVELVLIRFGHYLHPKLPLRVPALIYRVPQVAPVEICVLAGEFDGLVPYQ